MSGAQRRMPGWKFKFDNCQDVAVKSLMTF